MSTLDDTEVTRTSAGAAPESQCVIGRGDVVGRFSVLAEIGVGGMGRIFEAYDPKLDRRVALKVLRDAGAEVHRQRLVREAQALARLDHPNVVTVHDVGTHGDALFVAMEFVPGGTLKSWLAENPPGSSRQRTQTALELLVDAGRGLVAAHSAGLVHRDIKPSNILIGQDGRARVADFGIARALDADPAAADAVTQTGDDLLLQTGDSNSADLTQTGASVGTPAYMAPEQFGGKSVGAASDQFSYCVTAWELLYGVRPFSGDSVRALLRSIAKAAPNKPTGVEVSPQLEVLLRRGLKVRATARHRYLVDLVQRIEAIAQPGRQARSATKWWLAGLGGVAAVAGVASYQAGQTESLCEGAADAFASTWNEQRRVQVREAVLGTEQTFAPTTWERVEGRMDTFAAEWVAAHRETCEATRVRGEQSTERMDQRMVCLQGARRGADAFLRLLEGGAPDVIRQTDVSSLPSIDACETPPLTLPGPDDGRALELTAKATALRVVGRWTEGLEYSREAVDLLGPESAHVTRAEVRLEFAKLIGLVDPAMAQAEFERAADEGRQAGSDRVVADAGFEIAARLLLKEQPEAARWWVAEADAAFSRAPNRGLRWRQAYVRARLSAQQEGFEAGVAAFERLVSLSEEMDYKRAHSLLQLAQHLGVQTAASPRANPLAKKAVRLAQTEYGSEHPLYANYLLLLCRSERAEGRSAAAAAACDSALSVLQQTVGPRHLSNARALQTAAELRPERGQEYISRALALDQPFRLGGERRARLLRQAAELSPASPGGLAKVREAASLFETSLGPAHSETLGARALVARLLAIRGERKAALTEARAAAELLSTLPWRKGTNKVAALVHVEGVFAMLGDHETATAMSQELLAELPAFDGLHGTTASIAHGNLCANLRHLGRLPQALEHCEAALSFPPHLPLAHITARVNHAAVLFDLARLREAKASLSSILDELPSLHDPGFESVAYSNLGEVEEHLAEFEAAEKHYGRALELRVGLHPSAYSPMFPGLGLVRVIAKQSRFSEASAQLKTLEQYVPAANPHGQGQLAETRGIILALRNKTRPAQKQFARAIDLYGLAGANSEVTRLCAEAEPAPTGCKEK